MNTVEIRLPGLPQCWETCGNCQSGEIRVSEVLVVPGERVERDAPLLVLETDKTSLDIPVERAGRVLSVAVAVGDCVAEGMLLATVAID